jgi:ribonuclease E
VHAARKEDRRLSAALLAAALAHTPEAEEALRGARTRMARKPAALARELLRNFPKGRRGKSRRRRKSSGGNGQAQVTETAVNGGPPRDAKTPEHEVQEPSAERENEPTAVGEAKPHDAEAA